MNPLLELQKFGQSYWLDNLTRRMMLDGELERRVQQQGLRGVTSNPAIFNKAISGSDDYDDQIRELVDAKLSVQDIYERLVVSDVQRACDILRPVYDQSQGEDGFVSLEVSPYLAYNTGETMQEVRRLSSAVDRPNLLIKIPGTPEGVPAIEEMLFEGININITLLFSIGAYESVAESYLRALERRLEAGRPLDRVASVASFFISRIDVLVDRLLNHRFQPGQGDGKRSRPEYLPGRVGIANAKMAYQRFQQIFTTPRWKSLGKEGGRVQRMLWASTSTKNPLYSPVSYVEPLIGPHTVNTLPEETIEAIGCSNTRVDFTVEAGLSETRQVLADLAQVGIDLDSVTEQLLNEGVQKFISPFDELMQTLAEKRLHLLGGRASPQFFRLGPVHKKLNQTLSALAERQIGTRLAYQDPSLWPGDPDQIKGRLGWLSCIQEFLGRTQEIRSLAERIRDRFEQVVLLGMGGSSLAAQVLQDSFGWAPGWPQLYLLDSTAPETVLSMESQLNLEKALFIVASKSGTTLETLCLYRYFQGQLDAAGLPAGDHFVAITDPETPLSQEAQRAGFLHCFENPADIGGRFSALSYFGLVPAALLGIDIQELLVRARRMLHSCGATIPPSANPGVALGAFLASCHQQGRNKVTFVTSPKISSFAAWAEQLLAESMGKDGRGMVPVTSEPGAPTEGYGEDRALICLSCPPSDSQERIEELEQSGHPLAVIQLEDPLDLGPEFLRWEIATAVACSVLGINPFDQPEVDLSKRKTEALLSTWRQTGVPVTESEPLDWRDSLKSLLEQPATGSYFAVLAFFHPTPERQALLQSISSRLEEGLRAVTTIGYGPRYLHSTGQLHKAGPDQGRFLILTADHPPGPEIPGAGYDFGTLLQAQASGDLLSLKEKGRSALRLHLGETVEEGLARLLSKIKEFLGAPLKTATPR